MEDSYTTDDYLLSDSEAEEVPPQLGDLMNEAIGLTGWQPDYQKLLLEEDQEALDEISGYLDTDNVFGAGKRLAKSKKRQLQLQVDKKRSRRFKAFRKVSPALEPMLAKANLAYIQGHADEAIKLLHELIRQEPHAYQCWGLLAMAFQLKGDAEREFNANLIAAHMSPKDLSLWMSLGNTSMDCGDLVSALYCYNKAIKASDGTPDIDLVYRRAVVCGHLGRPEEALSGFEAALREVPDSMEIVRNLVDVHFNHLKDPLKALQYLEQAELKDAEFGPVKLDDGSVKYRMGLDEINMLCELHIHILDYDKCIMALKKGVYRLNKIPVPSQGLLNKILDSDDEIAPLGDLKLPVELQTKLGVCRLIKGQRQLAETHLSQLFALKEHIAVYCEFYVDVSNAYAELTEYSEALNILLMLTKVPELQSFSPMFVRLGYCYRNMNKFQEAIDAYKKAIELIPDDSNLVRIVAEIYDEMGMEEMAIQYYDQAHEIKAASNELSSIAKEEAELEATEADEPSLLKQTAVKKRTKKPTAAKQRQLLIEETAYEGLSEREIIVYFNTIKKRPTVTSQTNDERLEFIRKSKKLMAIFKNTIANFTLKKLVNQSTAIDEMDDGTVLLESCVAEEAKYEPNEVFGLKFQNSNYQLSSRHSDLSNLFHGISFKDWLDVFVQYALLMVHNDNQEAFEECMALVMGVPVFKDKSVQAYLKMLMVVAFIHFEDYMQLSELFRWFYSCMPSSNDAFRLYLAIFAGGNAAASVFAMNTNQRFFNRAVKAVEALPSTSPEASHPVLFTLVGHIFACARGYGHASQYYLRAYRLVPTDPLINLCLGIAYIQRAMQRKSKSRNQRIIQGFVFVFQYQEIRGVCDETDYNVARAYQLVGLDHLAEQQYRKLLERHRTNDSRNGIVRLAAYNLSLLYMSSSSMGLTQKTLKDFCTL